MAPEHCTLQGEDVAGRSDVLLLLSTGRVGADAGSGATGVRPETRRTVAGRRTTWYESVEGMQKNLDGYLEAYTTRRPHRERGIEGRTPHEGFKAGILRKPRTPNPSARKGG